MTQILDSYIFLLICTIFSCSINTVSGILNLFECVTSVKIKNRIPLNDESQTKPSLLYFCQYWHYKLIIRLRFLPTYCWWLHECTKKWLNGSLLLEHSSLYAIRDITEVQRALTTLFLSRLIIVFRWTNDDGVQSSKFFVIKSLLQNNCQK